MFNLFTPFELKAKEARKTTKTYYCFFVQRFLIYICYLQGAKVSYITDVGEEGELIGPKIAGGQNCVGRIDAYEAILAGFSVALFCGRNDSIKTQY